ncbi:tetratricopeptide repeat protein [Streptomyces johnsoniae]|uniref:Tetratricopeptide repeat protein n=1 Tax=Streptomyces johnsoniae TaxID=3075532 RepID=A0ABU2RXI7_9ACTN|nr:tetratricopeptide repeat protein [Streptomyces sp. DSM 41886]MDT0441459.1 tetratricopeptide repeat protein [Streptomyces sp. DSM 41886]
MMVINGLGSREDRPRGLIAALCNASGLGAGYLYLRLWGRAVGSWIVTLLLVVLANALNASDTPLFWGVVYVLWLAVMVADARLLGRHVGRRGPEAPSRAWLPVAVGAALFALVAAGLVIYRGAPADELAKAEDAHAAGDCEQAQVHYDRAAASRYEFTLSPAVADARAGRISCRLLLNGEEAAEQGALSQAISDYTIYLNRHDGEPPWPSAEDRLAELRLDHAAMLLDQGTADGQVGRYQEAFEQYMTVRDEHPDTPAAEEVPGRLNAMFDTATMPMADGRPCETLTALEGLTSLPDRRAGPEADELAGRAEGVLPDALFACGEARYEGEEYAEAREALEELVTYHPDDARTDRASDLLVAIEIDEIQAGAAGELPPPTEAGSTSGGSVTVEIINDSPEALEVLYSGAETGTQRVSPCEGCTTHNDLLGGYGGSACASDTDRPTLTLELPAGSYEVVVRAPSDGSVSPFYGSWDLTAGTAYSDCYYISESQWGF